MISADNGLAGVEALRENTVDIVITDMKMPCLDGMRVFYREKKDHPEIPVIMVSAYSYSDMAESAVREGAFVCAKSFIIPALGAGAHYPKPNEDGLWKSSMAGA